MYDVVIAGAGPAGSVAASVLARAGARVALIDRARFPRHKLCGDTVNPGVLAILRRLKLASMAEACGLPIAGMILTGQDGSTVEGRYPDGLVARAVKRSDFDWALVRDAVAAGADFMDDTTVLEPIVESAGHQPSVAGLWVRLAWRTVRGARRGDDWRGRPSLPHRVRTRPVTTSCTASPVGGWRLRRTGRRHLALRRDAHSTRVLYRRGTVAQRPGQCLSGEALVRR